MGLFGALNTAVTGMNAQSFALENVSGNIANSQTIGFKRIDTSFVDLIPSDLPSRQLAGSVASISQSTNTVQGNIQSSTVGTYLAINGNGFFVVEKPSSIVDGRPVFSGTNLYTRRGDFQPNKDGYLVNGAGNYLMGIPIDPTTGNLAGSVPTLLQFQNDFLPAQATTSIDYRANLARYPLTTAHDTNVTGSELLNPVNYTADPTAGPPQTAHITGSGATLLPDNIATLTGTVGLPSGSPYLANTGSFTINGQTVSLAAGMQPATILDQINLTLSGLSGFAVGGTIGGVVNPITIQAAGLNGGVALNIGTLVAGDDVTTAATKINAALTAAPGGANGISVSGATGQLVFTSANGDAITLAGDTTTLTAMGFSAGVGPGHRTSLGGVLATGFAGASLNGSDQLVLKSTDADHSIQIAGSVPNLFTELGINVGTTNPTNLLTQTAVAQGQTMDITVGPSTVSIVFGTGAGQVSTMAELAAELATLPGGVGTAAVNVSNGNISITAAGANNISVTGTASALAFGMHVISAIPSNEQVVANDLTTFLANSVGGGAITCYDISGSPVNMQIRWAKIDSTTLGAGHTDTWNMFYQIDSSATGTAPAWQNAGVNFSFDPNGQMNPVVASLTLASVTVDGVPLGNVDVKFGAGGITEFADPNGGAQVNTLTQNGFAAGSLQSITVNDKGRVVGSYSNGRTIDRAQIVLANFSGANYLKRVDGGTFEQTDDSGVPTFNASGAIVASSLESSNTDIAGEFTKLIVTQQAYSANTRVISTANQMAQDLLNTLR
jgi:flagellar hook protein FlgE